MLTRLRKPVPDRDRVVIIESSGLADIAAVTESDDQAVYAESADQDYAIPIADLKPYVGPAGRIWLLCADQEYVQDTKHLAELQQSIVLRQITQFSRPADEDKGGLRIKDILFYLLIAALLLGVIFK